jgi:hypothetical protein
MDQLVVSPHLIGVVYQYLQKIVLSGSESDPGVIDKHLSAAEINSEAA